MPETKVAAAPQDVRSPRGIVTLNGELVPGWVSWSVDTNEYRSADTFRIVFAVSMLAPPRNAAWFSTQQTLLVEIFSGLPADPAHFTVSDLQSLILGQADEVRFDPVQGTIELSGRDLTARLIDTKTSEHFANQTASQIASTLAKRHGLTPVVTATHTKAGEYYQIDHARVSQQQSEWELLCFLANVEDFVLYVRGRELHFERRGSNAAPPYPLDWHPPTATHGYAESNAIRLDFSRALTIAKGVTVEVHSWNAKHKKGFKASWPKSAHATQPGQARAHTQVYRYTIAGLTPDQALQRAQSLYRQIVAHEMHLSAYLPGDNALTRGRSILVQGTGTAFDQLYFPESVARAMSVHEGYRMTVRAKNIGPDVHRMT